MNSVVESARIDVSEAEDVDIPLDDTRAVVGREPILLPVGETDEDRVETLADAAGEAAGMAQTNVHILHVFTPSRFERAVDRLNYGTGARPDPDDVVKRIGVVREVARELHTPVRDWGMTVTATGRIGESVSDEVVAAADETDAKRVVVGGRRRTPTGKTVFGSTAQEVLLTAPCPVTFVRNG